MVDVLTLETIRKTAAPELYPRHMLAGCTDALVLFAAAFHGMQDAVFLADAGLDATCVDVDHGKLDEMTLVYPEGWEYVHGDVFEYATTTNRSWDLVSLDPPSNLFDRCAELLPLWCLLANRAVILGHGHDTAIVPPTGWAATFKMWRSTFAGGCYWTVLERC